MVIKIATLNLCLGLPSKKNLVKELIVNEKIDILCMQETEVDLNLEHTLLGFPGYQYESENTTTVRARVGCYINSGLNYVRRTDLEGANSHLLIMDVRAEKDLRIINIYRSFNPIINTTAKELFETQLRLINEAFTNNTVLLGDFNLDWNKKGHQNYAFKNYFETMDRILNDHSLVQLVKFPTWSRTVLTEHRESTIDHIYSNNPTYITNVVGTSPYFGDHLLISFQYSRANTTTNKYQKRSWKGYSKESLCQSLADTDWNIENDDVQGYWNEFENRLINVVDNILPLLETRPFSNTPDKIPNNVKTQINLRKNLLKKYKNERSTVLKARIKELNYNIKFYYHSTKAKEVRRNIIPGNSKSLWSAVKKAKSINFDRLPPTMFSSGVEINNVDLASRFATCFDDKIKKVLAQSKMDETVYNGSKKVDSACEFFMNEDQVFECLKSLKIKNCEGYDRIPQRILVDGAEILISPLAKLFNRIYYQRSLPDQWLVSKTIPVFKNKGDKKVIDNYRPIANLCSTTKIFEKLILKRIMAIQDANGCDVTNSNQHGFKKGKSTTTLSMELQSLIARALDEDKTVRVSSLDLSSAFDVVDVNLLLKRMKIMGLPEDLIELVSLWLRNRFYYVSINGINSTLFDILLGTVQGSILGPIL